MTENTGSSTAMDKDEEKRREADRLAVFGKSIFAGTFIDEKTGLLILPPTRQVEQVLGVTGKGEKIILRPDGVIEVRAGDGSVSGVGLTVQNATGDFDGDGTRDSLEIRIDNDGFKSVGDSDFAYKFGKGRDGKREIHFRRRHRGHGDHDDNDGDDKHDGHRHGEYRNREDGPRHPPCREARVIDPKNIDPNSDDALALKDLRQQAERDANLGDTTLKEALDNGVRLVRQPDPPEVIQEYEQSLAAPKTAPAAKPTGPAPRTPKGPTTL